MWKQLPWSSKEDECPRSSCLELNSKSQKHFLCFVSIKGIRLTLEALYLIGWVDSLLLASWFPQAFSDQCPCVGFRFLCTFQVTANIAFLDLCHGHQARTRMRRCKCLALASFQVAARRSRKASSRRTICSVLCPTFSFCSQTILYDVCLFMPLACIFLRLK